MTPQTKNEERKTNGISPTRFVILVVAPMLTVIGWQTLMLIDYGRQLQTIHADHKRFESHSTKAWHETAGIHITELRAEARSIKEDIREIRRELSSYRGYSNPYQQKPQE